MPNKFVAGNYSRVATQVTFNRLKRRFLAGSWLSGANRYQQNCIERIGDDCKLPAPHRIKESQLAEYIAASAPLHCMDGWSFLGKAIISHVMGDAAACKHFAYYAELRAAMSLLASEGMGVFNDKHFSIVSANGVNSKLYGPLKGVKTHPLVRDQFEDWAKSPQSADLFDRVISPQGTPIRDWFSAISTTRLSWIAQDWLVQWGYDLTLIGNDQIARNEASYRPSGLTNDLAFRNVRQITESLGIVESIWRMCSLDARGGLTIDLFLLRRSWERYAKQNKTRMTKKSVVKKLTTFGISGSELIILTDLFTRKSQPKDPVILEMASTKGNILDTDYHLQMMSRATLLLRLATGVSAEMIRQANIAKQDLQFWWESVGENHGLWQAGENDPMMAMWSEVDAALQKMTTASPGIVCHYDWRTDLAEEMLALSGCERIGLSQFCI